VAQPCSYSTLCRSIFPTVAFLAWEKKAAESNPAAAAARSTSAM
jgi:uncharacterized membrane protein